ncbi:hypothetical protein E2320_010743, partial [Naja naja]
MSKRVAVVGSGVSGLTSIKACLEEGLEPTCFEQSNDIGGLWRFTETVEERKASIYRSLTSNSSKEMSCFSDFPMPDNFPNFLHNTKFLEYLRLCPCRKMSRFPTTGQWNVIIEKDGKQESFTFDAVMVCTGHQIQAYTPLNFFPGFEKFKGNSFHSQNYKDSEGFEGKTVVIIGMGNSAADIAVEICKKAKKVVLSARGGTWVMSRISDNGYPWDTVYHSRFINFIRNSIPWFVLKWMTEQKMNQWFNHENYGLVPQNRYLMKEPVFNDDLPSRILCGYVSVKPLVRQFTETSAIFEDGTVVENVDIVIFATGYSVAFPFLDKSVLEVEDNRVPLYKHVFSPHLEKPTLAVIGLIQPLGPIMPTSELQARWATRVFKGLSLLPSERAMMADTIKRNDKRTKFGTSRSQSIQTVFIDYLDELAAALGSKPDLFSLLLWDPILAWAMFFGPCNPFQFRLKGPGKWTGARDAILTQNERIIKPTKTRVVSNSSNHTLLSLLTAIGLL